MIDNSVIRFSARPGANIADAAEELLVIANALGRSVSVDFNGTALEAWPGEESANAALARWMAARGEKQER